MASFDTSALAQSFPASSDYSKDYGWAAIAGTIILGFGREQVIDSLAKTIRSETNGDKDVQLKAFRKLREALLKASPLVGFPRSINGLAVLRKTLEEIAPDVAASIEKDKSLRSPVALEDRQRRGKEFFSKIYAQHTDRVLHNLNASSGGDLGEFAINCIYGDLVAETSILDAKETGLLEFVACVTLTTVPQAKGHMYGAHNLGNSGDEIKCAFKVVESLAKQLQAPWDSTGMEWLSKADKW